MKSYVGLDLGTSSVKVLQRFANGETRKESAAYHPPFPDGWISAALDVLSRLDWTNVAGIGLASQTGTYIVDSREVISWNAPEGKDEMPDALSLCNGEEWDREIGMQHPHLVSYPLPRLMYIRKHFPQAQSICQPKDYLLEALTGERVTDRWTWRGLCSPWTGKYSRNLLDRIGADETLLPPVRQPTDAAGCTKGCAGVPAGIRVYTGLNDFYASLLGMGMREGELFDITGTSEHLGVIEQMYRPDRRMVSGPWLSGYAHYGVTASSGSSLAFGRKLDTALYSVQTAADAAKHLDRMMQRKPPVFLPYLNGERAPVWDPEARGVFFGLSAECGPEDLSYAVLEGVCFSVQQVYEALGSPEGTVMKVSGGAAANALLNLMKAELTGCSVTITGERDTTALGAAITAMIGDGYYADLEESTAACGTKETIIPSGNWKRWLTDRYGIYQQLYPALKESMKEWKNL